MEYRNLGRSGLKVSVLSLGSFATFGPQFAGRRAAECLDAARSFGVNFFDNAESYANGESERMMGKAIAELAWPRHTYVISTKFFSGLHDDPNTRDTLNRKYLFQAIDGSLQRLGLDFVDLIYCHRADPGTPIEETVWAMSDIISSGKALYWGTSEWTAVQIRNAWEIADSHHLHKPIVEQPEYNLMARRRVEQEYRPLYEDIGLGLTTWSPLAFGLLSGKYRDGVPAGSRASLSDYASLREKLTDKASNQAVSELADVARDLGCTTAQLAVAWCTRNPHVSTVITGASSVKQIRENMSALDVASLLDDGVCSRIEAIFAGVAD